VNIPILHVDQQGDALRLRFGPHAPAPAQGPACLTFHTHPTKFTAQENHTVLGHLSTTDADLLLEVDRLLADVSLTGNKLAMTLDFLSKGRRLAARLKSESARHAQPVPKVRLPRATRSRPLD
jgi:hypothetical protein